MAVINKKINKMNKKEFKTEVKNKIIQIQDEFKISYVGMAEMCEISPTTYAIKKMDDSGREFTQLELDRLKKNFTLKSLVFVCGVGLEEADKTPKKLRSNFTKVYVMIDKNTGFYKIGRSINPKKREKTLQSEKPTIEMLFNHDARVKDEKKLHNMFSDKRVRGEWFDLNGSDLNKIRQYFDC